MRFSTGFFISIFIFIQLNAYADKLEKGFEKLKSFDYFAAKEYFEKTLDDETAAAAYGLSTIYSTSKNPFYNPDSARRYILIADSTFKNIKEKTRKYYSEMGVSDTSIGLLSEFICEDAFNRSKNLNSSEGYNHFLKYFNSCLQFSEATLLRNAAAFNEARSQNTSVAYSEFIALYPQSAQYKSAMSKFDERVYDENTDGTIESYEYFIQNFPENPFHTQAENMIYSLSVPDKKLEQYVAFARKYKNSSQAPNAWREIYKLSMKDFSEDSYNKFKNSYPDYPFPDELETDFRLQNYFFLPYEKENSWGYINDLGQEMIKPSFEEASLFSEGLAAVSQDGKYGYINKAGKKIIDFKFQDAESFHNGNAVVLKDSLYGLINKNGDYIIPAKYQELAEASDDIFMAVKGDSSGYIQKNGKPLTQFIFDVANDYKNGYAIISKDEKYGLLNERGSFNIEPAFDELVFIGEGLLKGMTEDEMWGIINLKGDTVLPFAYEAIGEFNEHRALVATGEKCGYVNEQGSLEIPLKFRYSSIMLTTGQFQNGYALLKQNIKSAIIDSTGKVLTFPGCQDYGRPSQGLIPVKKNGKWGFVDIAGKIKIPCKYESAETFNQGFANIRMNKMTGLIDTTGNVFIPPLYEDIVVLENTIMVRSNGKSGLLSRLGILLIPCNYDKVEFLTPAIARATNAVGFTYINLINGKIIYNSE
jgi:WG containing repeat